jgi:hypothetical protein
MVAGHADALRSLRGIWIDAGRNDEWHLDLGAEAFRLELAAIGVTEPIVRFELFEGTHADLEYRYPMAIGWLAERISGQGVAGQGVAGQGVAGQGVAG